MGKTGTYALIINGSNIVENIIVANDDFKKKGYYTIRYDDGVFCEAGMYYNEKDGLFYSDPEFFKIHKA